MGAGDLLRRLDSRVLPRLARALNRLAQAPLRARVLSVAALVSVTAVLITAVWAAGRQPTGDLTVGDVVRVGVTTGDSIPRYVSSSRAELAELLAAAPPGQAPADTYALVTFSAYLPPDRLAPILDGVWVSEVFGRVPLSDTQTEIVRIPALRIPADVIAGMARVAERKDREARDYQRRSAALPGAGDEDRQLRTVYDSGAQVAFAEATAYRTLCSCLYAAVVRATPAVLERVAGRPQVRAVDPAPEVRRLDRAVFLPPLPEQADVVRPPADGVVTATTAAPGSSTPPPAPSPMFATETPVSTAVPSDPGTDTPQPPPSAAPVTPADPPARRPVEPNRRTVTGDRPRPL